LRVVVVIAVVTVCLPCFGLSLDYGHGFQLRWALPSTALISWVVLCCLYCLCFVNCTYFGKTPRVHPPPKWPTLCWVGG